MTKLKKKLVRYSISFKQKVVREIEQDGLSISQVKRMYNITGGQTVQKWIKDFGKNHLLGTIVRVEMKDEKDRIKELEQEVKKLKIALADAVLARDVYQTTIDVVNEHYQTDVKKNLKKQLSQRLTKGTNTK